MKKEVVYQLTDNPGLMRILMDELTNFQDEEFELVNDGTNGTFPGKIIVQSEGIEKLVNPDFIIL